MKRKHLLKSIGFFETVSLGLSLIIGSGIFILPILIAKEVGIISLVGWLIGALYSFLVGITLSDLAIKYPKEGGPYEFVHKAFGNNYGFLAGWILWLSYVSSIAVEIIVLKMLLDIITPFSSLLTIFFVFLIFFINLLGLKASSRIEDLLTITRLIIISIFVYFALQKFDVANLQPSIPEKPLTTIIIYSAMLSMYSYTGFEIITLPGEEIKNARKIVRRSMLTAITISLIVFLLVNISVLGIENWQNFNYDTLVDLSLAKFGKTFAIIIALAGIISVLASINALIIGSSRVTFSMSKDGVFFRFFRHLNDKGSPDYAIIIQVIIAILLLSINFEFLLKFAILSTLIIYGLSCLSAFKVLPKQHFFESRLLPTISIIITILLLTTIENWFLLLTLIFATGFVFYFLEKRLFFSIKK